MADPVKISELPAISSVQPGDIIPIVDSALTQTSRATAAQIAAIGGGRPGDGTVDTATIQNGAVTAAKVSFTGPDKLISRTAVGSGNGVEIPCTTYARGLLASASASEARSYLDALQGTANPTFSGTLTVNGNAIVTSGATLSGGTTVNSGLTVASGNLSVAGNASVTGTVTAGGLQAFFCRAWFSLRINNGTPTINASGSVTSISKLGTGWYQVNFAPPYMPDRNYVFVGGNNSGQAYVTVGNNYNTDSLTFWIRSCDLNVATDRWGLSGGGYNTDITVNGAVIR